MEGREWVWDDFNMVWTWRQLGYNLIWEAIDEVAEVDEELSRVLEWCQAKGEEH